MGQEIVRTAFSDEDREVFRRRLRDETKVLKRWFDERMLDHSDHFTIGLELEAWLVDSQLQPAPQNEAFLKAVNDPDIVEELSKFNFELNAPARPLGDYAFSATHSDLDRTWSGCVRTAGSMDLYPVLIGILPTVRDDMLRPSWMSDTNRYRALNQELLRLRKDIPVHVSISGKDPLDYQCDHIMLEAACTSLQAHLKINQDNAVRYYNAAVLAAAPLVAATANSPFLYGHRLWEETRIPAFEQSTAVIGFRDHEGRNMLRVSLGEGYLRHSFLELFLDNLSFSTVLPELFDDVEQLPHLRLHNGTIWRWVRPIIGFDKSGTPHLRLEHRVIPAGPSLADTVANLALCHGLVLAMGQADAPPEALTPFEDARANFYACAKDGLRAQVCWERQSVDIKPLLIERLLPQAREALVQAGIAQNDLSLYFDDILIPRIKTGKTGANWQRSFVAKHGLNLHALMEGYIEHQSGGAPVHTWTV